ncbi:hypothetical protein [Thermoanaerobacterium thermosaccharolyticum]|uniref:Uncharacterized protein n=1 Tax=Thermoanaerobacterium thermosaccharolyticum M0795 TaxID=698948 RepID=L0IM44_THETR|nr:hypothetical protein [Thermoanaerobacterium thermosaccharolyticum]AGB19928.1 hypothetical protein Thethe_02358 [Thermoanaerobacterium thermosaccharolyticum M0795]
MAGGDFIKIKRIIIFGFIVAVVLSLFIYHDYYSYRKSHYQIYLYQTNDAPNLNYTTESKHFKINTTIEIGKNINTKANNLDSTGDIQKAQDSNEFTSLNYTIRVENISKKKLNNIKIVAFLDKGLEPYIVSGLLYFGTPIQQRIDLNVPNTKKKDNCIDVSRSALLPNISQFDADERQKILDSIKNLSN